MQCKDVITLASESLDGRLDEATALALREHLASCPACAAAVEELRETVALLQALKPVAPPASVRATVRERLARPAERRIPKLFALPVMRLAAAAALLMLVTMYGLHTVVTERRASRNPEEPAADAPVAGVPEGGVGLKEQLDDGSTGAWAAEAVPDVEAAVEGLARKRNRFATAAHDKAREGVHGEPGGNGKPLPFPAKRAVRDRGLLRKSEAQDDPELSKPQAVEEKGDYMANVRAVPGAAAKAARGADMDLPMLEPSGQRADLEDDRARGRLSAAPFDPVAPGPETARERAAGAAPAPAVTAPMQNGEPTKALGALRVGGVRQGDRAGEAAARRECERAPASVMDGVGQRQEANRVEGFPGGGRNGERRKSMDVLAAAEVRRVVVRAADSAAVRQVLASVGGAATRARRRLGVGAVEHDNRREDGRDLERFGVGDGAPPAPMRDGAAIRAGDTQGRDVARRGVTAGTAVTMTLELTETGYDDLVKRLAKLVSLREEPVLRGEGPAEAQTTKTNALRSAVSEAARGGEIVVEISIVPGP